MEVLTDHQLRLLKICDHVRWGENYLLDSFKYHMVRRACGQKDQIVEFELQLAVAHLAALGGSQYVIDNPDAIVSPEVGTPERSPWMETYRVTKERYDAIGQIDTELYQGNQE